MMLRFLLRKKSLFTVSTLVSLLFGLENCAQPECTRIDYKDPECRIQIENHMARIHSSSGFELRFQTPSSVHAHTWHPTGLFSEAGDGSIIARLAHPGDFAISITTDADAASQLELQLHNLDPRLELSLETQVESTILPFVESPSLTRTITIPGNKSETFWLRGRLTCPATFRLAVLGDVQTNPAQFSRILERLREEKASAQANDEPLLGILLLGDLTERSDEGEFATIRQLIDRAPVPVAVTAGNHDIFRRYTAVYNQHFGPGNYAFDLCSSRIALLDSGNGSLAPSLEGRLDEFFERKKDQFLLVGTHYPLIPRLTGNGWVNEEQAQHLLAQLAMHQTDLILTGHVHDLRDFSQIPVGNVRLRQIIVGTAGANQGLGVALYGYLRIQFGEKLELCFVEVPPVGAEPSTVGLKSDSLKICQD